MGSELACALAHMSKKYGGTVTQVYPEAGTNIREKLILIKSRKLYILTKFFFEGNLSKILPEYLSKWTTKRVKEGENDLKKDSLLKLLF